MALAALTAGCATRKMETHHFLTGRPAPAYTGPVRVFMEGAPLPGAYEEVALVQVLAWGDQTVETLLPALQGRAASLGGDALILVRVDQGARQASVTGVAVRLEPASAPDR